MKDNILGFDVIGISCSELLDNIFIDLNLKKQNFVVNINPFIIMNFYNNQKMIEMFNKEAYQIPDGIGIVWASKYNKKIIKERITGIDLMEKICERAKKESRSIFLCGAAPGVAVTAKRELEKKYKKIKILGTCDGYISEDKMVEQINESKAEIVFIALGSPKQEEFILNNREKLKRVKLIMPVGGSFDVISKKVNRAPEFIIKTHTEWLYRMIKEPKRIKRNISLLKFVFLVIWKRT